MGHWEPNDAEWYEQKTVYCDCCGLVIPKKHWVAEVEGAPQIFCGPDCEKLYREYRLPAQQENR